MSTVAGRLANAGFQLPSTPTALGLYVPARRAGSLVFTSGQLPIADGRLLSSGLVGDAVDVATARACAQRAALNALAAIATIADLDDVAFVVRLTGYVASAAGFVSQPAVIDGASEVLAAAFGDSGAHARVAVGVAALPLGAPVEVELVVSLAVR